MTSHYLNSFGSSDDHYLDMPQFKDLKDAIVIRVLKRDQHKSFIHSVQERYVIKGAKTATFRFSEDGKTMALFYQLNTGKCILEYVKLKQNEGVIEFISKLRSAATDDHIFFGLNETY